MLRSASPSRRPARPAKSHTSRRQERRERRHLLQLLFCGGTFCLLVLMKLFLPTQFALLQEPVNRFLMAQTDVQAVFAAAGHLLADREAAPAAESSSGGEAASGKGQLSSGEGQPALDTSLLPSAEEDEALPVCMEQQILGFAYCSPLAGELSSPFGYRDPPTEGSGRFHYGIDIAAESGTPIRCFADGTVLAVAESSSYGNYLMVEHENGVRSLYAHCHSICVTSGSPVTAGEEIAYVGESGQATGPHLHFELQKNDEYLNPVYYV